MYTARTEETAFGTQHRFEGPGMPQYANGVHFLIIKKPIDQQQIIWIVQNRDEESIAYEAGRICHLLEAAYGAGRDAMKKEVRDLFGWK